MRIGYFFSFLLSSFSPSVTKLQEKKRRRREGMKGRDGEEEPTAAIFKKSFSNISSLAATQVGGVGKDG